MFDIDAGYAPIIRLDAPAAVNADEEIAAIEKQMEALSLRHCELMEAKRVAFAQSRPIPASAGWMSNDIWETLHRPEVTVMWAHNHPEAVAKRRAEAQRSVLSGTTPMIARSAGHIDRMTAAAAGEIEDPAAGLRLK